MNFRSPKATPSFIRGVSPRLIVATLLVAAAAASYLLGRVLPRPLVAAWLYLPFVLLASVRWGRGPGVGAALLASVFVLFVALKPLGQPTPNEPGAYLRFALSTLGLIGVAVFVSDLSQRSLAAERRLAIQAERAAAQQRQSAILDSISDILVSFDRDWRYTYVNAQAERLLRRSRTELLGRRMLEVFPDAAGSLVYRRALEAVAQQRTEQFEYFATPFQKWFDVRIYPSAEGASLFWADITDRKRDETALRLVTEASAALAGSLDYETTLTSVARLAVQSFADWCVVDVLENGKQIRRIASAHRDPAMEALLMKALCDHPPSLDGPDPVANVLRTGRTELGINTPDDLSRSYIVAPLSARGPTLGAISFHVAEPGRHYGPSDVTVAEEVAQRAAAAIDIAQLYRQLQQTLQTRDEFLAAVSHDLRTPLTAARGMTQLLARQVGRLAKPESERMLASLNEIERATKRMGTMVDELLDLARIEAGRPLTLKRSQVDLVALAHQVAADQQRRAPDHVIHVETTVPSLRGYWDPARLERVLINLLTNAVKYSPAGGDIAVSLSAVEPQSGLHPNPLLKGEGVPVPEQGLHEDAARCAVLTVGDHGIGIPAADLPQIFDRFHRGTNVVGQIGGLGIGLAGAKQIVEQHGGAIGVKSEEGHGSTFTVRLPLHGGDEGEE